jgi:hypothetical protein
MGTVHRRYAAEGGSVNHLRNTYHKWRRVSTTKSDQGTGLQFSEPKTPSTCPSRVEALLLPLCTRQTYNYGNVYGTIPEHHQHNRRIGDDPGILEALTDATGTNDLAKLEKEAHEQYLAVAFLLGANSGRYGKLLLEDLENDFLQGQDRYPKTVTTAFSLLTNWK